MPDGSRHRNPIDLEGPKRSTVEKHDRNGAGWLCGLSEIPRAGRLPQAEDSNVPTPMDGSIMLITCAANCQESPDSKLTLRHRLLVSTQDYTQSFQR